MPSIRGTDFANGGQGEFDIAQEERVGNMDGIGM
jgi:hypothetical protein